MFVQMYKISYLFERMRQDVYNTFNNEMSTSTVYRIGSKFEMIIPCIEENGIIIFNEALLKLLFFICGEFTARTLLVYSCDKVMLPGPS